MDELSVPDALILAGGRGTRLRPLTDSLPKALVPVGGRPFLEHIVRHLVGQSCRRLVITIGFRGEQIREYFGDGRRFGCQIDYVVEPEPLGVGGAIQNARRCLGSRFFVVSADVWLDVDLRSLLAHHRDRARGMTMVVASVQDRAQLGAVALGPDGRAIAIQEKEAASGPGLANAGAYVIEQSFFTGAPRGAFCLVRDWMQHRLDEVDVFVADRPFVDIGTHAGLARLRERWAPAASVGVRARPMSWARPVEEVLQYSGE